MNGEPLYYRAGTPNSDGTITWLDAEQNVTTGESNTGHLWPTIAIDSGGYPWIAYARKNVTENTRYAYITKSSTNTGTWTTASGFPHQLSSENYTCIQVLVVPLTNQKVLAIASNAHTPIKSFQWNGSSWGTQQNITSSIADVSIFFSAVNQGDDVHLAFVKNSTYDLVYAKYNYSSDLWGTETTIQSAVNETSSPVLSIDTSTNDLYCFWAGSPETNAIYYKRYNGTDWVFASDSNPWITEAALAGYYKYDGLSGFYQTYDHKIGLAYTNGTTVYYVKFKYFNITAPEVTVIVTYPANTTYSTPTISVQLSASGGIIDKIWWNCKNGTTWIYGSNQTYTAPTSMTGFVNGTSYTFYVWANNTLGEWDEETVMFTVAIESAPPASVTLVITSPANTTYTSSTITISLSASGGTIDKIWWNIQFENASWLYVENQTYTVATSVTIDENVTATFHGYANNTDGNSDDGSVVFTVYIVPNTIGYQLSQAAIAAAGMLGIVMLLGMVYVALEGKDIKYAVMLAVGEVLLLVTMLVLSQLSILG
jgi:hypothetical protein